MSRWFIHSLYSRHITKFLASARLTCNPFGQQGPDRLLYLWLLADGHAQSRQWKALHPLMVMRRADSGKHCNRSGLVRHSESCPVSDAHLSATASVSDLKACGARSYRHEVLIAINEAATERALGWT
jgi:hypothetical protein